MRTKWLFIFLPLLLAARYVGENVPLTEGTTLQMNESSINKAKVIYLSKESTNTIVISGEKNLLYFLNTAGTKTITLDGTLGTSRWLGRIAVTPTGEFNASTIFTSLTTSDDDYKLVVIDTGSLNIGAILGGSRDGVGVLGITDSNTGTGIEGFADSAATGVYGHSSSIGSGVHGSSQGGYGVQGETTGSGTAGYFENSDTDGYAGYFVGRVNIEGDFTVDSGTVPYSHKSGTATYAESVAYNILVASANFVTGTISTATYSVNAGTSVYADNAGLLNGRSDYALDTVTYTITGEFVTVNSSLTVLQTDLSNEISATNADFIVVNSSLTDIHNNYATDAEVLTATAPLVTATELYTSTNTLVKKSGDTMSGNLIVNASVTVDDLLILGNIPTQNLKADSTISSADSFYNISSTGDIVMSSTPTITSGTDGQFLILQNTGTYYIDIQDDANLTGSGIFYGGSSAVIAPKDIITFLFDSAIGGWVIQSHPNLQVAGANADIILVRNTSGATIPALSAVYAAGYNVGQHRILIDLADADDAAKMPAIGITPDSIADGANGSVVVSGIIEANLSAYNLYDVLYASTVAGALTNTRPSVDAIQALAIVTRAHTKGSLIVMGAGRTNDVPINFTANIVTVSSLTITGANVILKATATYSLDSGLLDGLDSLDFIKEDGSVGLTADWDAGDYQIHASTIRADGAKGLYLLDDGGNGIFIADGGNVGVGTNDPNRFLTIKGDGANLRLIATNTGGGTYSVAEIERQTNTDGGGIGITFNAGDSGSLEAAQQYAYIGAEIETNTAGSEDGALVFSVTDSGSIREEAVRITSNGDVGINTTAPTHRLEVNGQIYASSITFTASNIVLKATSTFANNSGLLNGKDNSYFATQTDLTAVALSTGVIQTALDNEISATNADFLTVGLTTASVQSQLDSEISTTDAEILAIGVSTGTNKVLIDTNISNIATNTAEIKTATTTAISDLKKSTYTQTGTITFSKINYEGFVSTGSAGDEMAGNLDMTGNDISNVTTLSVNTVEANTIGITTIYNDGGGTLLITTSDSGYGLNISTSVFIEDLTVDNSNLIKKDGSVGLTADWDAGDYQIHASTIRADGTKGLYLLDDGGNGIFIENGGKVGIGTTGLDSLFTLEGVRPLIQFNDTDNNAGYVGVIGDGHLLEFGINRNNATGAMGDTARASANIQLRSNVSDSYITFKTNTANNTWGIERMRIDKNGNIGINDDTPSYKLDVNGTGRFTGALTVGNTVYANGFVVQTRPLPKTASKSAIQNMKNKLDGTIDYDSFGDAMVIQHGIITEAVFGSSETIISAIYDDKGKVVKDSETIKHSWEITPEIWGDKYGIDLQAVQNKLIKALQEAFAEIQELRKEREILVKRIVALEK